MTGASPLGAPSADAHRASARGRRFVNIIAEGLDAGIRLSEAIERDAQGTAKSCL
jgi:hypothetical protein